MSLLMDALKRAEREKREAAEKLKKSSGEGSEELSLTDKYEAVPPQKPESPPDDEPDPRYTETLAGTLAGASDEEEDEETLEMPLMGDSTGIDYAGKTGEHSGYQEGDNADETMLEDSRESSGMDDDISEDKTLIRDDPGLKADTSEEETLERSSGGLSAEDISEEETLKRRDLDSQADAADDTSEKTLERSDRTLKSEELSLQQPSTPAGSGQEWDLSESDHDTTDPVDIPDDARPESEDKTDEYGLGDALERTHDDNPAVELDISSSNRLSRSIVSAAELAKDIGSGKGQPTPVAAQTVFSAVGGQAGSDAVYRWGIFIGLCAVIALALGAFYYLSISPLTPSVNPRQVANTAELSPVITTDIDEIREAASVPDAEEAITEGTLVEQPPAAEQADTAGTAEIAETADAEDTVATVTQSTDEPASIASDGLADDAPTVDVTMVDAGEETGQTAVAKPDEKIDFPLLTTAPAEPEPAPEKTLPEKITVNPEAIKISRSKVTEQKSALINSAYRDYIAGNYQAAALKYRALLSDLPDNPDAMLGLAAIAYRQGNVARAYEYYLQVLKLHPHNKTAKVALINLQQQADSVERASAIKLLIQETPQLPYLHFSLGNLYAGQLRWPDAQQAYFDAYRLEPGNADYAFNLAVSLDHIGQRKAALDYYNIALNLTDQTPVNFNKAGVISRINTLSNGATTN